MEKLNENNERLLQKFMEVHKDLPVQFSIEWKDTIEKSYKNCKPHYFLNNKEGEIKGIFPFFFVESKRFGNRLISQPFIDFGGPVGEYDSDFIVECLNEIKLNFKESCEYVEVRLNNSVDYYKEIEENLMSQGFEKDLRRQQFILDLTNEEELWGGFDRITRKAIKKAEKSELKIREINGKEELKFFYELYIKSMRNFGTPQHSLDYFEYLLKSDKIFKGLNCWKDGKLISSLIILHSENYAYAAYNFSEPEYLKYQPNDLLYWEIIKWAIKSKIKKFDFGQVEANAPEGSHAAGIFKFKNKWGGKLYDRPYFYYYFSNQSKKVENKRDKYAFATKLWKKLPLFILNIVGPKICAQLAL